MNKLFFYIIVSLFLLSCKKYVNTKPQDEFTVNISLQHKVDNAAFVANTNYTNSFGETFKLNKFHYYLTNFHLLKSGNNVAELEPESYHLVKAEDATTHNFSFKIKNGAVNQLRFLVGVDSTRNVSGAQTGALDPLNGMFWTWNSGYIMAKMEGTSPQSTAVNNLVTYHIGGFSGANTTLRWITLNLPTTPVINNIINVNINCNINKFFNGTHNLKIVDEPIMMNHGVAAAKYADNYATMFSIQ